MGRYVSLSEKDMEGLCGEIYELMMGRLRPMASWDYTMGIIDMMTVLGINDEWNTYVDQVERR